MFHIIYDTVHWQMEMITIIALNGLLWNVHVYFNSCKLANHQFRWI